MNKLRIMTYNLGWLQGEGSEGVNYKPRPPIHFKLAISSIAKIIEDNKIDLTAIQEVDFFSKKSHYLDQFESIKNKIGQRGTKVICWNQLFLPYPYLRPWGRVTSGGAFLSKFHLISVDNVLFDAPSDMFMLRRFFYLKRFIQINKIVVADREEFIFNVHLEAFDFKAKCEQLLTLKKLIKKYKPLAIMGDFNTLPEGSNLKVDIDYSEDPAVELLPIIMHEYKDIFGNQLTFPAGKENCRLDYIWVKKDAQANQIELKIDYNPSDHNPLALEISW